MTGHAESISVDWNTDFMSYNSVLLTYSSLKTVSCSCHVYFIVLVTNNYRVKCSWSRCGSCGPPGPVWFCPAGDLWGCDKLLWIPTLCSLPAVVLTIQPWQQPGTASRFDLVSFDTRCHNSRTQWSEWNEPITQATAWPCYTQTHTHTHTHTQMWT